MKWKGPQKTEDYLLSEIGRGKKLLQLRFFFVHNLDETKRRKIKKFQPAALQVL